MMLRQARIDMGYGLVDLMDAARDSAERVHVPYLMLHGLGDRIVPQEPVQAAIEVMPPRPDSKLAFYKEGYHLLLRDKEGKTSPPTSRLDRPITRRRCLRAPTRRDSQPEIAALWGSKRSR